MTPRFHCPGPLATGDLCLLPPGPTRHVQVLRLQPGAAVTLFDGRGGEFEAVIDAMGRQAVRVRVGAHSAIEREAAGKLGLAIGMPANDRMDWIVEKVTELGVARIQPLITERSVLRIAGERAQKKQAHWQSVAIAACEQCGRNRLPAVLPVATLPSWLAGLDDGSRRLIFSLAPPEARLDASSPDGATAPATWLLIGPEGGFSADEEAAARRSGFAAASLGPRVLRSDTAAVAAVATVALAANA